MSHLSKRWYLFFSSYSCQTIDCIETYQIYGDTLYVYDTYTCVYFYIQIIFVRVVISNRGFLPLLVKIQLDTRVWCAQNDNIYKHSATSDSECVQVLYMQKFTYI